MASLSHKTQLAQHIPHSPENTSSSTLSALTNIPPSQSARSLSSTPTDKQVDKQTSSSSDTANFYIEPDKVLYAFIINPSKPRAADTKRRIKHFFKSRHLRDPLFIDTTLTKDGSLCAKEALEKGSHVVVACGGDGTVRTVAETMAHSGRIMGVIPAGTANLFCRNIGIPINNIELALQIVVSPGSRYVDMGWLTLDAPDGSTSPNTSLSHGATSRDTVPNSTKPHGTKPHDITSNDITSNGTASASATSTAPATPTTSTALATSTTTTTTDSSIATPSTPTKNSPTQVENKSTHGFLLIAGVGFDATMIKATDPNLKKAMGWVAYFIGGMNHLYDKKYSGKIAIKHKGDDTLGKATPIKFRTCLIGNCGKIPLFSLIPAADVSDGLLDFELIDTNHGIVGWVHLANNVIQQTIIDNVSKKQAWSHSKDKSHSRNNKAQSDKTKTSQPQISRSKATQEFKNQPSSTVDINSDANSNDENIDLDFFSSYRANIINSQGTEAHIELDEPIAVQADGDLLGSSRSVYAFVDHNALIIRAPLETGQVDATGVLNPIDMQSYSSTTSNS